VDEYEDTSMSFFTAEDLMIDDEHNANDKSNDVYWDSDQLASVA